MQGGDCAPVSLVKTCKLDKKAVQQQFTDQDAVRDFIVARDDGRVEIYAYVLGNVFPSLCFECQIKSTITSIDHGNVTMANSKDVILTCYDGKILSLIDTKKFKKQGIMASEAVVTQDEIENAEKLK